MMRVNGERQPSEVLPLNIKVLKIRSTVRGHLYDQPEPRTQRDIKATRFRGLSLVP
jgi:hypothetical protein